MVDTIRFRRFARGCGVIVLTVAAIGLQRHTAVAVEPLRPLSPQQSLATIRTKPDLAVELVAAEPLVASPVAIDFGPDGKLWVAEMYDYPQGLDGNFQPGGRVRLLESTKGDGRFDTTSVFLDGIPFPTGITVWRKGVLVCAAPDILYAEDTDGDGRADLVKKLYSGFGTDNYQARVNSLEYGLDGWVYGSCGLFGGQIASFANDRPFALGDRDFRIRPDTGEIEAAIGRTQQGRVRDDWDNWFGCDNGTLARHYPLADHDLQRNPYLVPPETQAYVPTGDDPRLFPLKGDVQLFKLSGPSGRPTAACGLGIYRDTLLGDDYLGNTFTCEPVNLLVHRMRLSPHGSTFAGTRAGDEQDSEFLAASDNWFRPVQARTGPDGALWVVDMYRHVIEHPRWIPPEVVANLDVRAGQDLGRIYRVKPKNRALRPWPRLDRLDTAGLVAALGSDNGWQRDMATQTLVWRDDQGAVEPLRALATAPDRPLARLHALCALDRLGALPVDLVRTALRDPHAGVRRHAVRLAERFLSSNPAIISDLGDIAGDADPQVRLQLASTLGAARDPRGSSLLATLALRAGDSFQTTAVLSSLRPDNVADVVVEVLQRLPKDNPPTQLVQSLLAMSASLADDQTLPRIVAQAAPAQGAKVAPWRFSAAAGVLDALERRRIGLRKVSGNTTREAIARLLTDARRVAGKADAAQSDRLAAMALLGRDPQHIDDDLAILASMLGPQQSSDMQQAAATALARIPDSAGLSQLAEGWSAGSPALKGRILDALLSRGDGLTLLLDRIESGGVPPQAIDATRRQRLVAHRDAEIRARAGKLLAGAGNPDRRNVLEQYQSALNLAGDRDRGRAVFTKTCSVCHRLEGVGHDVGPDLAALANKSPQALLMEVFDPNRNLDSRYTVYTALTKAGRTLSGLLAAEAGSSITLEGQEGKRETVLRVDLEEFHGSNQSLMPEGLEKDLSLQDVADLLVYLTGQGPPAKSFAGNRPAAVKPADGALALLATNASIFGQDILFEEPFRNIGFWRALGDHLVWSVEVPAEAEFDVWLDWSCADASAGNRYVLTGAEPALRGAVAGTGGWDRYRRERVGSVRLAAGTHRLTLQPDGERLQGALMDLRGLHLVPPGAQPAFTVVQADRPAEPADVPNVARRILDDSGKPDDRAALIRKHLDQAGKLVAAMTADLKPDPREEYRRIPWIWNVAIAAGRENKSDVLKGLLEVSLPGADRPLRDWQAVVIGGGILNGISQLNLWPRDRIAELIGDDKQLAARWKRLLEQAAEMADNEKTPTGTRYDALRIIPLDAWQRCGPQLQKYLAKGIHDELQMGAISGISDVDRPQTAELLLAGLGHYSDGNRKIALDALLRTDQRVLALLKAVEQKKVVASMLSDAQRKALVEHKNTEIQKRAQELLHK